MNTSAFHHSVQILKCGNVWSKTEINSINLKWDTDSERQQYSKYRRRQMDFVSSKNIIIMNSTRN